MRYLNTQRGTLEKQTPIGKIRIDVSDRIEELLKMSPEELQAFGDNNME